MPTDNLTINRKLKQILWHLIFCLVICSGTISGQVSMELNGFIGKPLGKFGENINRDAFFGINVGLFYKPKKTDYVSFGMQFYHLPYDESTLSALQSVDNLFIRQRFRSKIGMQSFHGTIRVHLNKQNKFIIPYFDGILGLNRFYGITKSEDAFFQGDTNNNGVIEDQDGEINPEDFGITPSVTLAKASKVINHNALSPTFGLAFGLKIKIIKSLHFNLRYAYTYGFQTTYYDEGTQEYTENSIDNFLLVRSATSVLFWTLGLQYTFE